MAEGKNLGKTSFGIGANLAAALSYVFGFITGILFLVLEKENKFVKFHALQSILLSAFLFIANTFFLFIPVLGWLISFAIGICGFILWIICMFKAYSGEEFKVPVIGDIAQKNINKA